MIRLKNGRWAPRHGIQVWESTDPAYLAERARRARYAALLRERYAGTWWTMCPAPLFADQDDELTTARRRRELAAAFAAVDGRSRAAR